MKACKKALVYDACQQLYRISMRTFFAPQSPFSNWLFASRVAASTISSSIISRSRTHYCPSFSYVLRMDVQERCCMMCMSFPFYRCAMLTGTKANGLQFGLVQTELSLILCTSKLDQRVLNRYQATNTSFSCPSVIDVVTPYAWRFFVLFFVFVLILWWMGWLRACLCPW